MGSGELFQLIDRYKYEVYFIYVEREYIKEASILALEKATSGKYLDVHLYYYHLIVSSGHTTLST